MATSFVVVVVVRLVVVVVVVVVFVADDHFMDPFDETTHSREDGWMFGTGTRSPRPACYPFQRPVG